MNLTAAATGAPRPRLLTRPLGLAFASSFGALTSFYLLLSVMPGYATSVGAGGAGAGLANGALLLVTIVAELVTPRLVARFQTGRCWRPVWCCSERPRWS